MTISEKLIKEIEFLVDFLPKVRNNPNQYQDTINLINALTEIYNTITL